MNGSPGFQQPSDLQEEYTQKVVDRTSILGVRHRYWLAEKYKVTMTYTAVAPGEWQQLSVVFYNFGNGLNYYNDNSGLSFFGYPLVAEDKYIQGNTYLKNVTVTLEQE